MALGVNNTNTNKNFDITLIHKIHFFRLLGGTFTMCNLAQPTVLSCLPSSK